MSPLEQVLSAAKKISDEGRTPTLALVKSKLGSSIPMPILIQGLQQFKSMSSDEIKALSADCPVKAADDVAEQSAVASQADTIAKLEQELVDLKAEFNLLKQQLNNLEKQCGTNEGHK
ncbi:hypothetical protein L2719_01995 [Shewanella schlegeliana]|uniref:KfrA N-terminal DNA-binding domain-containing protein n=1 Tax=Shewanella schlegeliana TaxID=190308 RepID=A0ABS1SY49_9GAMM|nr:hypothetical protein [Shewanella schlegeliana]MBL4913448.1 hypothetical protein [Shewanella schlegeliana]MCL1108338.1 hypothetical protein [Shewanella schlegeliana]GIU34370.1 hypothetical protein TUM4433_30370 [Shewanella schlegeliana]